MIKYKFLSTLKEALEIKDNINTIGMIIDFK